MGWTGRDVAVAHGRQRDEAEVDETVTEAPRIGDVRLGEVEGTRDEARFDELVGQAPDDPEQQIGEDRAADPIARDRPVAKHVAQHEGRQEREREDREARGPRSRRSGPGGSA